MFPGGSDRRVRFGTFEVDLRSGELWKDGVRVKVTEQPFSVLAMLLTRPGDVVTRDELRKALWPADTFVDFDRGLNKAINRLRDALGDSADAPRYIETLPKRGYRFIAPLSTAPIPPPSTPKLTAEDAIGPGKASEESHPRAGRPHATSALNVRSFAWVVAIGLVLLAGAWGWWRPSSPFLDAGAPPVLQSQLLPPPAVAFVPDGFTLSRDGVRLAFVAEATDGARSLWIRDLSTTATRTIAGTDGATFPFWSPDGRRIGFFASRRLKIVEIASGAIRDIAAVVRPSGGTWNEDDEIVFAPDVNGSLLRVNANGGTPSQASLAPDGQEFQGHRWPMFLPGTRQFLFVELTGGRPSDNDNAPALRIGSLDTLESDLLDWEGARSVAFALGHIMYYRGGALYGLPFDAATRRVTGPPVRIASADLAEQPAFFPSPFTVSTNGVLVFQSDASKLVWLDADGRETRTTGSLPKWADPALSPDGLLLAGSCEGTDVGTRALCMLDLERGVSGGSRLGLAIGFRSGLPTVASSHMPRLQTASI
jgi:DNA-binding winged helix-turn-helix (wHTH) protein